MADLLRQCGWLSVRQLSFYHSVILIYKTILIKYTKYIHSKLSTQFPYNTRLAESESVRMGSDFQAKLDITERSFMNRATVNYNQLPAELRKSENRNIQAEIEELGDETSEDFGQGRCMLYPG